MPYFNLSSTDITIINKDKSFRVPTKDELLDSLDITPESADPEESSPCEFETPKDQEKCDSYVVFDKFETAAKIALFEMNEDDKSHFAIFEVAVLDSSELCKVTVDEQCNILSYDHNNKTGFKAYLAPAKQVQLLSATFKHIDAKFEDIVITEQNAKSNYDFRVRALTSSVRLLANQLNFEFKEPIVNLLKQRLDEAPDAAFDGTELTTIQPAVLTKLQILQKESELLKKMTTDRTCKRKNVEAALVKHGLRF